MKDDDLRRESTVTEEDVWQEHLRSVHAGAHTAYVLGVLAVGLLLMVALIAWLGGSLAG